MDSLSFDPSCKLEQAEYSRKMKLSLALLLLLVAFICLSQADVSHVKKHNKRTHHAEKREDDNGSQHHLPAEEQHDGEPYYKKERHTSEHVTYHQHEGERDEPHHVHGYRKELQEPKQHRVEHFHHFDRQPHEKTKRVHYEQPRVLTQRAISNDNYLTPAPSGVLLSHTRPNNYVYATAPNSIFHTQINVQSQDSDLNSNIHPSTSSSSFPTFIDSPVLPSNQPILGAQAPTAALLPNRPAANFPSGNLPTVAIPGSNGPGFNPAVNFPPITQPGQGAVIAGPQGPQLPILPGPDFKPGDELYYDNRDGTYRSAPRNLAGNPTLSGAQLGGNRAAPQQLFSASQLAAAQPFSAGQLRAAQQPSAANQATAARQATTAGSSNARRRNGGRRRNQQARNVLNGNIVEEPLARAQPSTDAADNIQGTNIINGNYYSSRPAANGSYRLSEQNPPEISILAVRNNNQRERLAALANPAGDVVANLDLDIAASSPQVVYSAPDKTAHHKSKAAHGHKHRRSHHRSAEHGTDYSKDGYHYTKPHVSFES